MTGHSDYVFAITVYIPPTKVQEHIKSPLIITVGYDYKVNIWNSESGELIKSLTGHKESVTSVSLFAPDDSSTPLLISTGIDKLIIIWAIDVEKIPKTKILRKLNGHTDRVCDMDIYTPTKDSKNSPVIISGIDDRTLVVWSDCLHFVETMPTQASIVNAFKLDLDSEERWPLMKEMTKQYGISFWIENTVLYYLALLSETRRLDFFKTFLAIIKMTIRYTNKIPVFIDKDKNSIFKCEYRSLLRCAIEVDDVLVVQLIVECWLENLNKDIEDPLTQRLYHPSYLV